MTRSNYKNILGISAFYHDSGATLVSDGAIVAAVQEERFSRKKHDSSFPVQAITACLDKCQLNASNIDAVVFYEKPFLKFERLLETYLTFAPRGFTSFKKAIPVWIKEKLFQKAELKKELRKLGISCEKIYFSSHHYSHAASAFFPSPFKDAAILCLDGVGEWATTTVWCGHDNEIELLKELHFPHSLGLLYSAFTYYAGFRVNSGEYKLMGLAPYGRDLYSDKIKEHLVTIAEDGSFMLDMSYFDYATGLTMITPKFEQLFERKARKPEAEIEQFHMDIARSIQVVTEEIMLKLARSIKKETGLKNLCLAGGVALNCVANGKILKERIFDNIWIQPPAGDAGGSLGAAIGLWFDHAKNVRIPEASDSMKGSYLGPRFTNEEIFEVINSYGMKSHQISDQQELISKLCDLLTNEQVGGLFQGPMEFGPRALGGRSIIADPRSQKMQSILNLKIKFRESFRPFAPAVLAEKAHEWFELEDISPYMLLVADVTRKHHSELPESYENMFGLEKLKIPRSTIPAVTHLDFSARVQTVHAETNPFFYKLIESFDQKTNFPILVNTSFNVRGEPIVGTPEDALRCFMRTEMDFLVLENHLLLKNEQPRDVEFVEPVEFELD